MVVQKVFDILNILVISITMLGIISQALFIVFFPLKKKHFKKSQISHKVRIIVPARNESAVIGDILRDLQNQDYDKNFYEIMVVAHNCTDNTAQIARDFGVKVIEHCDEKKYKASALQVAMSDCNENDIDFYVIFDADNKVEPNFLSIMNDAFSSGVNLARSYNSSKNYFQNFLTACGSLYYVRDARFTAQAREALKLNSILLGTGQMVSNDYIKKCGGFPSDSISEDADLTVKAMLSKEKIHYVCDAVFYEEQPSTLKDFFNRNMRMGHGLNKLFWIHGWKLIFKFFTTFKYTYLDVLFSLMFIPISVITTLWFPIYYCAITVSGLITGSVYHMGETVTMGRFGWYIGLAVAGYFGAFIAQALLACILERRNLPKVPFYKYIPSIFATPIFMLINSVAITIGAIMPNVKWKKVARTKELQANITNAVNLENDYDTADLTKTVENNENKEEES